MADIIVNLLQFFGVGEVPLTVSDFLFWFISVLIGIEFILFILDGLFYAIRSIGKAVR